MRIAVHVLAAAGLLPLARAGLPPKPNLVFIMTDDTGYETLGFHGARNYRTPVLDRLARESTVFTQCDATPLCCPSRTQLITGQYTYVNYEGWEGKFIKNAPTIAEVLKSGGYATGAYGKWHLGRGNERSLGFDDACLLDLNMSQAELMKHAYYQAPYLRNGARITAAYGPDLENECALAFIEQHRHRPFFLYYTPFLAHNPFCPTPDSRDPRCDDWQTNFEDMVAYADKLIGKVIAKLKACGIYDRTIIFFTGDNGTKTLAHLMPDGSVIYGGKGTQTVDGCHVPLLVKTDGRHRLLDDLIDFADFHPTMRELAGIPDGEAFRPINGISFAPLLRGARRAKPFTFGYFPTGAKAGIVYLRDQRFKYHGDQRLYDLQADPRELSPFYPESDTPATARARQQLAQALDRLIQEDRLKAAVGRSRVFALLARPSRERLLGARIFDQIRPEREATMTFGLTPYVSGNTAGCTVRFSRSHASANSGLIYADAEIRQLRVVCDGREILKVEPEAVRLTTRYKAQVVNPWVDFVYDETRASVRLEGLRIPAARKKLELVVDATLRNPGNQWGDRIQLYTYLQPAGSLEP